MLGNIGFLLLDNFLILIEIHQEIVAEVKTKSLHSRTSQTPHVFTKILRFLIACFDGMLLYTKIDIVKQAKRWFMRILRTVESVTQSKSSCATCWRMFMITKVFCFDRPWATSKFRRNNNRKVDPLNERKLMLILKWVTTIILLPPQKNCGCSWCMTNNTQKLN